MACNDFVCPPPEPCNDSVLNTFFPYGIINHSTQPLTQTVVCEMQPVNIAVLWNKYTCDQEEPSLFNDTESRTVFDLVSYSTLDPSNNGVILPVWKETDFLCTFFTPMGNFAVNHARRNAGVFHLNFQTFSGPDKIQKPVNIAEMVIAEFCRKRNVSRDNLSTRTVMQVYREMRRCESLLDIHGYVASKTWDEVISECIEKKYIAQKRLNPRLDASNNPLPNDPSWVLTNATECIIAVNIEIEVYSKILDVKHIFVMPFFVDITPSNYWPTVWNNNLPINQSGGSNDPFNTQGNSQMPGPDGFQSSYTRATFPKAIGHTDPNGPSPPEDPTAYSSANLPSFSSSSATQPPPFQLPQPDASANSDFGG